MHYTAEQQKINTPVFFSSSHHNVLTRNVRKEKERNRTARVRARASARTQNEEKVLFGFEKLVKEFVFTFVGNSLCGYRDDEYKCVRLFPFFIYI